MCAQLRNGYLDTSSRIDVTDAAGAALLSVRFVDVFTDIRC